MKELYYRCIFIYVPIINENIGKVGYLEAGEEEEEEDICGGRHWSGRWK
jgi:hypothetical protein